MRLNRFENFNESFLKKKFVKNLLFVFSILLGFPNSIFSTYYLCADAAPERIAFCLDESWQTALNLALENSFVFGKDFVFTYGPLGFLSTRVDFGINFLYFVLFDLFVAANFALIIHYVWKRYYNFAAISVCLLLCWLSPLADASFKLLLIMLFWTILGNRKSSAIYFTVPFLIAVISFFIKLNTSFLAVVIFYIFLSVSIFKDEKISFGKIALALFMPLTIFLGGVVFKVDFAGYIFNGLELINNYNDSMNYISSSFTKYTIFIAATALLSWFGFFVLFLKNKKNISNFCAFAVFSLVLFVLFKQSLVRSDGAHLFAYLYFAPVIWLFTLLFFGENFPKLKNYLFAIAFTTLLISILPLRYATNTNEFNPFSRLTYFAQIFSGNDEKTKVRAAEKFKLPDEILQIIGQKSVDIVPQNVNLIYFNHLNYDPRPVFQSYAAYSEKLLTLNRQKYESENAPEFIIFSNEVVDNRYSMFEDQEAKIAILENYSVHKKFEFSENTYLLLEKNPISKSVKLEESQIEAIRFYENYEIKNLNAMYFLKIKIDYSPLGKISKILYQPLPIKIVLNLDDGATKEFRAVRPILESGVIVNPLVESDEDYECFFKGETNALKKIKSFRIEPFYDGYFKKPNLLNYEEPFKIEAYKFSINN